MKDYNKKGFRSQSVIQTKIGALLICALLAVTLFGLGIMCIIEPDKDISTQENRSLKPLPEFSVKSLTDGSFEKEFEEYYSDHFVKRDMFMKTNNFISDFFTKNKFKDDQMVIVEKGGKDDFAGQSIE